MLRELQDALVALVSDGALAARYQRAPAEVVTALCPSAEARRLLAGLPSSDLARYAEGLRRKRWDEVEPVLSLCKLVIAGLGPRYRRWLRHHPAPARDTLLPPGAAEALRALPGLYQELREDPGEAAWVADLLAFEVLRVCSRADGEERRFRSDYAAHTLAAELTAGEFPVDPAPAPHEYAFSRTGVRHRRLP